jgi:hypothetical protein
VLWPQTALNGYWLYTRRERITETGYGAGEIIVTGIGALAWLTYLVPL